MRAIVNHIGFEFKSVMRDKTLLLMNYLFPLAFYFMMAAIMPTIDPEFSKSMIPTMIVFAVTVSTLLGMPNPIVGSKEKGIYRSYKIYGVPLKSVLFIPVFTTAIHITIVSIIIYMTGARIFDGLKPDNILWFCGIYILALFALTGLGLLIGVCSPNSRITVLLGQLIFLPSMLIGGVMMPAEVLPETIQKISRVLPTSHLMSLFRVKTMGQEANFRPIGSIIILLIGGLLSYILAAYLFTWDPKENERKRNILGLIALLPYIISIFI